MKVLIKPTLLAFLSLIAISGCVKKRNYSQTDHTVGMGASRTWSGNAYGYYRGDTLLSPPDTTHTAWPKIFSRVITDTPFAVQKINGFAISILGNLLPYRATDSVLHTVRFDTTYANSATTVLIYYYVQDSMTFEYHKLEDFNAAAGHYYETHEFLHTN